MQIDYRVEMSSVADLAVSKQQISQSVTTLCVATCSKIHSHYMPTELRGFGSC